MSKSIPLVVRGKNAFRVLYDGGVFFISAFGLLHLAGGDAKLLEKV